MATEEIYENEMLEDSEPAWIRTLASDGSSRRTKTSLFEKSGSLEENAFLRKQPLRLY